MTARTTTTATTAPAAAPRAAPLPLGGLALRVVQLALLTGFVALWEVTARAKIIDPFFFSTPTRIGETLGTWFADPDFYGDVALTILETALGFLTGTVLGVALGFLFARNATIAAIFDPVIVMLNAIPRVLLVPIIILWFGLSLWSKVAMATILVFFIVFFATFTGIREVEANFIDAARILGARSRDLTRHVLLPSALTWIFSSLRTSVGFAFVGAVVAEYFSSNRGLGHRIQFSEAMYEVYGVYAGMAVLVALAVVIDAAMQRIERRFSVWKPQRGV